MIDETTRAAGATNDVAPAAAAQSPTSEVKATVDTFATVKSAADHLGAQRARAFEAGREASAAPARETESAPPGPEADAAPAEPQAPGETDAPDAAAGEPPIEPPRSWTREAKEAFKSYPPEAQREIAEAARRQEAEVRRYQSSVAEQSRAAQADALKYQQARQQYEYALTQSLAALGAAHQGEFADIRTQADVDKLASEDPLRYVRFKASQDKVAATQAQYREAAAQRQYEQALRWQAWTNEQDARFLEAAPEFKDPVKAAREQQQARSYLKSKGLSEQEMRTLYLTSPVFRDHRTQSIILDAARYQAALEKLKAAKAADKPVPQVQRPGVAGARSEAQSATIKDLSSKLDRTGSLKAAQELRAALLAAQSRRRAS
jgi:hypothetical protein